MNKRVLSLNSSDEEYEQFMLYASRSPFLAVDTEANGGEIRDSRGFAVGVSLAFRGEGGTIFSTYMPFRHEAWNYDQARLDQLRRMLESHPNTIYHNAKFDIPSLATLGIKVGHFYDTLVMAHMLNENELNYELDALTRLYCKVDGKKRDQVFLDVLEEVGWVGIPAAVMFDYAENDAVITLLLFEHYMKDFQRENLWDYWEDIQLPFIRTIIGMEGYGIKVDTEIAGFEYIRGTRVMTAIKEELGLNPGSTADLKELLIDQMGLPVVKQTPKGKPSFDKFAMAEYEEMLERINSPVATQVLTYRGWQKTISSNYVAYMNLISPDGRVRPNYKIHGTKTGRLSCEKPNLQQIPRKSSNDWNGKLKKSFIPQDGYKLWEADFSQLELRLAAAYAGEQELLKTFEEGRDIFTEMSQRLGMSRQDTKTLTYTIQYGGGNKRVHEVFGVSMDRAKEIRENFYETYPRFRAISALASKKCKATGEIKLWSGRKRHFANRFDDSHKAFNSVIQGGAADIVKLVMNRLFEQVHCDDCRMLLQVHDSVVFEIREGLEDKYLPEIRRIMEDLPDFEVRFAVDIHPWGE